MAKRLFLLDGMALVYRAHFALMNRPIFTSQGLNTSALYGFTQSLLEILNKQAPTHIAVAFDTEAPTHRHHEFPDYKIQREAMPEDIGIALPNVRRLLEAFRIPVISCDGWEADDLIGTLTKRAEAAGFESFMVTPDKDFAQLVSDRTYLYKPARMGDAVEILGVPEICAKWGIQRPEQVIDILALWGDTSDNIPGVPGIGEKTAAKLITQFGSVESCLDHLSELKGKLRENLESHRDQALLSKRLATICRDAPCDLSIDDLVRRDFDANSLRALLIEFEFNSIGRRLFGDDFEAGRGFNRRTAEPISPASTPPDSAAAEQQPELLPTPVLTRLNDTPHQYKTVSGAASLDSLATTLSNASEVGFTTILAGDEPKRARLLGLGFSLEAKSGWFIPIPADPADAAAILDRFRPTLESRKITKIGHDLKFHAAALRWRGVCLNGPLFDVMLAHSLIEPDLRHTLSFLTESFLGYAPIALTQLVGEKNPDPIRLADAAQDALRDYTVERADLSLQLRKLLEPQLDEKGQRRIFFDIETPLLPVLVDMECEGIRIDAGALTEFAEQLAREMAELEKEICGAAGTTFNLNSPKQLGQILFDVLKICEAPKKTRTGQYATDEQTLTALAPDHEIVQRLLDYRVAAKLKSTYADTLPQAIWPATGRVHTTYYQTATATGRLNSQNPNLQNIPIRTERGQEIRKAFVPRGPEFLLLSADYSQIELRIIAALSREPALLDAFANQLDIHTATAAGIYQVPLDQVTPEMRRKAKMVNYGIAYGISAFGLSQRLAIPRKEGGAIIDRYFSQFPRVRNYMESTIDFAREHGYVQTVSGRRRYIRDIGSSNATIRGAAERNAINAPIQGTAADMIKIAMARIHSRLADGGYRTRMLLQVHDELVFDLHRSEESEVRPLIEEAMQNALSLDVPIVVEIGSGRNWLEAH